METVPSSYNRTDRCMYSQGLGQIAQDLQRLESDGIPALRKERGCSLLPLTKKLFANVICQVQHQVVKLHFKTRPNPRSSKPHKMRGWHLFCLSFLLLSLLLDQFFLLFFKLLYIMLYFIFESYRGRKQMKLVEQEVGRQDLKEV